MAGIQLKEHNKYFYNKLEENLILTQNTIYVAGVGTGKTYITGKILEQVFPKDKVLFIVPKESVAENIKLEIEKDPALKKAFKRVDFINYQQFNDLEKTKGILSKYGFVVMDEVHHLGSALFGKNLNKARMELQIPFLGLTATPLRSDNRDITYDFSSQVNGLSNFEAIQLGYMPQIDYVIANGNTTIEKYAAFYEDDFEVVYTDEPTEDGSSRRTISDYTNSIPIIKNAIEGRDQKKIIVYSPNIASSEANIAFVKTLFPNMPIFTLNSKSADIKTELSDFNEAEEGILMTVDMALEGLHPKGVDTILLLRNVTTLPTFQQILGRVCHIGDHKAPLVIDCSQAGSKLLQELIEVNQLGWQSKERSIDLQSLASEIDKIVNPLSEEIEEIATTNVVKEKEIIPRDIMKISLDGMSSWKVSDFLAEWKKCIANNNRDIARERRIVNAVNMYLGCINSPSCKNMPEETKAAIKLHICSKETLTDDDFKRGLELYEEKFYAGVNIVKEFDKENGIKKTKTKGEERE